MNGSGFADWRIQNGFLQAWSTGQGRDTRKLLTRLQSLTQAVDQIPPETWRKYGQ